LAWRYVAPKSLSASDGLHDGGSCSIDPETGLFWVDDSLNYPRLIAEARTADGLRRRIAKLLDGEQLAKLMIRHNVGCRVEDTLQIKKIDEDFFE
jgi:hypothetical protein